MQSMNCGGSASREHRMRVQHHSSRESTIGVPVRRACHRQDVLSSRRSHRKALLQDGWPEGRSVDPTPRRSARASSVICQVYGQQASYESNPYHPASQHNPHANSNTMGRPNSNALATVDNGNAALKTKEQPKTVQVRFWLKFHVDYGQSIRLIGGHEQMGGWNLAKAPFLQWSEGDLWNTTLELAAGGVYEYKYVVVEGDGTTAASWQRGANNVLALQMNDEEVEVYDNWKNAPGALVLVDGQEITRERKLLAWANDMTVQRGELRRTRMELAQAREEIRVLRAELSVLRMEVSEANIARAAAEARQAELERMNSSLRLEIASNQASTRSTMEEAMRLLNTMSDEDAANDPSMGGNSTASYAAANTGPSASSSNGASGAGGSMFGGLFGFNMPSGNGKVNSRVGTDQSQPASGPGSAASAVVAAAAAMAAAADPRRLNNGSSGGSAAGPSGTYSPQVPGGLGPSSSGYTPGQHSSNGSSGSDAAVPAKASSSSKS